MEPKFPAPQMNPEFQVPNQVPVSETESQRAALSESGYERNVQSYEQQGEALSAAAIASQAAAPATLPQVPVPVTSAVPSSLIPVDSNPSVASDDDLIEKEWVDKAKQIIVATRDDPHRREREVSRLQADYLRKRYGKELGAANASE